MTESDGPTAATFFGELKQLSSAVPEIIGTQLTYANSWYDPVAKSLGSAFFKNHVVAVQGAQPPSSGSAIAAEKMCTAQAIKAGDPMNKSAAGSPFSYTSFDAVEAQGLAMLEAHSVQPTVYNSDILAVTASGKGKIVVHTFAQGKAEIARGKKIQYVGSSGPMIFDRWHNAFGSQTVISYSPVNGNFKVDTLITQAQIAALKETVTVQ